MIIGCLLETTDNLMTFAHDLSMYEIYASASEAPLLVLQKEEGFRIDVDKALDCIKKENVRAIIFSNPCNPTGRGLSKDEVRRLVTGTDALVVLDEAYMDFWDESLLPEVAEYDNLIILKTLSKAFGLAGLRVGFAAANPTLTRALQAVKSPYNVGLLPQMAAQPVTLGANIEKLRPNIAQFKPRGRNCMQTGLKALQRPSDNIPAVPRPTPTSSSSPARKRKGFAPKHSRKKHRRPLYARVPADHLRREQENAGVACGPERNLERKREGPLCDCPTTPHHPGNRYFRYPRPYGSGRTGHSNRHRLF